MDIKQLVSKAETRDLSDVAALEDYFEALRLLEKTDDVLAHEKGKTVTKLCSKYAREKLDMRFLDLQERSLLFCAPYDFDSYCRYLEWDREPDKRFYMPRRKQLLPLVNAMQDLEDDKLDLLAISLPPGVGKLLADDTPVLTRNGWKPHGELVVGDEVIGLDGEFKKVIAVHPKNIADVLVEFTNGEKIQCHENHEWMFYDRGRQKWRTEPIKNFMGRKLDTGTPGKRGHRYMLQLPNHGVVDGEEKDLPLDPYTLGVWLGDGKANAPVICGPKSDAEIIDRIELNGYKVRSEWEHKTTGVMYYSFDIRNQLQSMGMCHSRRKIEKYIPETYLTASAEQRLHLLAGLLDTDGCLQNSKYQFSTTGEKLRDGFVQLVSTFGWRTCVTVEQPKTSSSGIVGRKPVYIISFTPDMKIPCVLERKQNKKPHSQRRIGVKSITRVEPKPGNCITVEGGMYLVGRKMVPTHNSTLSLFYLTWLAGRKPQLPILGGSHSNSFLRGAYDECLRIIDPAGEYKWASVFQGLNIINTNAKDLNIDLGKIKKDRKRFPTLEFTSVGSGNAGKVRAGHLLYCDDLCSGIEEALSRDRMDKLWELYATDLRQRKIGNCKELHVATRWSVHDVIGRLEHKFDGNDRARFIKFPALNENDESNFDYKGDVGFSTQFYIDMRDTMDDASWRALYQNEPIEREGQLYSEEELRRYFELPDGQPDAIISVCDTKDKGKDYCVMPICYVYGNDYYIDDVVCDNGKPNIVEERLVQKLLCHNVGMSRFESNSAGGKIAEKVQKEIKEKGGNTRITTKYTTANKETKIVVESGWVKEHCLFKDASVISKDKEYRRFMSFLTGYTMMGKNEHDDVPDAMAMLSQFSQNLAGASTRVIKRPW